MTRKTILMTFAGAALGLALASSAAQGAGGGSLPAVVKTPMGSVRGAAAAMPGVMVYKGMPFGAAPVGPLRFREAQPARPWSGVLDGTRWGNACIQPSGKTRGIGVNQAIDMPDSPPVSEDCLNLNVWTPAHAAGQKLPVMVWYYGGAYNEGGGSMPFADGAKLASKGVIVVSMNYRTGAFGFLSYPELTASSAHHASGNQALSDSIQALKWVRQNIAAFGGDPNNVTIFGQSAGACISAALVGSPEARGLFRNAISESGAWGGLTAAKMGTREAMEERTTKALEAAGIHSLAELQSAPVDKLTKIRNQGIIVDGWIVPEDFARTFAAGRQNKVNVLLGSNGAEGSSFGGPGAAPVTVASWNAGAAQRWKDLAPLGMKAYPAATDAQAKAFSSRPFTDGIAWYMNLYAREQARTGRPAYLYQFVHNPPGAPGKPSGGPTHASELAYVFGNLAAPREVPDPSSPAVASRSQPDIRLADQMMTYWTNFAKTGNPNGARLPQWPLVTKLADGQVMLLDVNSHPGVALTPDQVALYDALYQRDVAGPLGVTNWK